MRLAQWDALAMLADFGVTGGAVSLIRFDPPAVGLTGERGDSSGEDGTGGDDTPPTAVRETVVAAGGVVFPDAAEDVSEFVKTYTVGRARDGARRDVMVDAATESGNVTRDWEGTAFTDLPMGNRDRLLRELGVDTADPVWDGTLPKRFRFHAVDELLCAFYVSPTGDRLVGIENPIDHPGETESYRRATMDAPDEPSDPGGEHDE